MLILKTNNNVNNILNNVAKVINNIHNKQILTVKNSILIPNNNNNINLLEDIYNIIDVTEQNFLNFYDYTFSNNLHFTFGIDTDINKKKDLEYIKNNFNKKFKTNLELEEIIQLADISIINYVKKIQEYINNTQNIDKEEYLKQNFNKYFKSVIQAKIDLINVLEKNENLTKEEIYNFINNYNPAVMFFLIHNFINNTNLREEQNIDFNYIYNNYLTNLINVENLDYKLNKQLFINSLLYQEETENPLIKNEILNDYFFETHKNKEKLIELIKEVNDNKLKEINDKNLITTIKNIEQSKFLEEEAESLDIDNLEINF